MPGPPKTPTVLADLRGNPGKRGRNPREPKPRPATANVPTYLPVPAAVIWRELAPEEVRLGLLTVVDTRRFATACRLQALGEAMLADTEARIAKRQTKPAPQLWAAVKLLEKAGAIFARFGCDPSSRTQLAAPEPHAVDHDPLTQLLAKRAQRPA